MGYPVYGNRIDTDVTANKFETADEVNVLRNPPTDLQENTMLHTKLPNEKHLLQAVDNS
jgi:hypothetical protein